MLTEDRLKLNHIKILLFSQTNYSTLNNDITYMHDMTLQNYYTIPTASEPG